MRINFDASFKDVSRLLRAPDRNPLGSNGEGEFAASLAAVAPDRTQPPKDIEKTIVNNDDDTRARMSFTTEIPSLLEPEIKPLDNIPIEEAPKLEQQNSVKTPTVYEVKRVSLPDTNQMSSENIAGIRTLIEDAGSKYKIDPDLAMSVVKTESDFNPRAISSDGHASKGLFQLLNSTGKDLLSRAGLNEAYDPFNPQMNVELGVSYLRYLHDIFSSKTSLPNDSSTHPAANSHSLEKLAVAAFNAGEGRVASAQSRAKVAGRDPSDYSQVASYLPRSTQDYVEKVLSSKGKF